MYISLLLGCVHPPTSPHFGETPLRPRARLHRAAVHKARGQIDGARNHTRISASIDCESGNYEAGIKAMEALMTRKHIGVPRADVASTPDGRVRPIDTARIPRDG